MDKTANSNVANALTPNATANTILPAAHFPTPSPRSPSNSSDHTGTTSSYDFLYELVQKRITTFSYLKRVHEGRIHWFNTPFDLDYFQTFYTLCDMLVEVYNKLLIGTNNIVAPNFIESVLKVDGKFKKIISQVSKEVDTLARNNLKEELRIIDPIIMMSPTNTTSGGGIIANTNNTAIINGNDGLWDEG
ncbi:9465_t:CDS:2 [Dentiscutata heterogama]|uniref:9465_t:CDS:1 n=1 Tax=Dentiscutata heterogama TaxID=1316150 RepID=A0ACA9K2Z2_9GLOM|nr:9465_t:CDS:2 [Dentiscutata heterogama]